MGGMTTRNLIEKHKITQQSLSKKTKTATEKNQSTIEIKGTKYTFELVKAGRGRPAYSYEEWEPAKVVEREIVKERFDVKLSSKKLSKVELKTEVMALFNDWKRSRKGSVKEFVEYINDTYDFEYTYRKHNLWVKAYEREGAKGLVDKRGRSQGDVVALNERQQKFLVSMFRTFAAGGINYMQLWEELHREEEKENGFDFISWKMAKVDSICDRGVVKRFLDNYYEKRRVEWTIVTKGLDLNKSYNEPSYGNRKEQFTMKNQCWEIDSTPADIIIFEDGRQIRPDILAIRDVYSGRCVAVLAENSNKLAIIRLMWKAINTLGIPDFIKGDNGRDYLSKQFQTLLDGLKIKYDAAIAYHGDHKGNVERGFRTVQHSYVSMLIGYIGSNVGDRQKIEAQTSKKDRKAKDKYGNTALTQTDSDLLLSWEEFDGKLQEGIYLWEIDKRRTSAEKSPVELWNECMRPIETVTYENFLIHAGGKTERSITKRGINHNTHRFVASFLPQFQGQKIDISENIDDVSEVFVFDKNGSFVGVATDPEVRPMTIEEIVSIKKTHNKEVAHISKTTRDEKVSHRTKVSAKADLERAKRVMKDNLRPQEVKVRDSVKLERDVKSSQREEFMSGNRKFDPFLKHVDEKKVG